MKIFPYRAVLLTLAIAASAACAQAQTAAETEAKAAFQSLYGQEVTRAMRTPSTADDVKLAGQLLDAAGTSRNQPELLTLICEKAYDLGKKNSAGYDVAVEAMHVLSAYAPDKKPRCFDNVLGIQQLRYAKAGRAERPEAAQTLMSAMIDACEANAQAGNIAMAKAQCMKASRLAAGERLPQTEALKARYRELVAAERIVKLAAGYEARLKADPSHTASREALINIYLIERNDPAGAAKWLNEDCDERLRTYIPMAAGDINAIPASTLIELGDWYKSLAASTKADSKGGMLIRAKAFYETFIEKDTAGGLGKTKAILALAKVKADIKKYGVKVPTKIKTTAAGKFAGVSRMASVSDPPKIPGLKAWTVEPRDYVGSFNDVQFSKDARQLITAGQDGAIRFWNVETGDLLRVLMGHDGEVKSLAWSPDRKTLASGSSDKTIRLWDTTVGKVAKVLMGSTSSANHLAWSPDSTRLASVGGRSYSAPIWSVRGGEIVGRLRATNYANTIAWSPRGGVLATGSEDGKLSLWNARTGKTLGHYPLEQYKYRGRLRARGIGAMAWSPVNSNLMAVCFSNGTVKLWRTRTRVFTQTMKPENKDSRGRNRIGSPTCVEWSPDGRMLAVGDSGSYGGFVWFWTASGGSKKFRIDSHLKSSLHNITWSPDGKLVATAAGDGASSLIDAESGEVVRKIQGSLTRGAARPDFSADGTLMAYSCRDGTIRIWDLAGCKQVSVISTPSKDKHLTVMKWSPDAARIAFVTYGGSTIHIVDVKSGVVSASLPGGRDRLNDIVWSADSRKIYSSQSIRTKGQSGRIQAWDLATSKVAFSLSHKKLSSHYKLAITADSKILASTTYGGKTHLWSLENKRLMRTIPADQQEVRCITFSPDGRQLASCGRESLVKVWSVKTGQPLSGLQQQGSDVYRVDFSPDGTKLVATGKYFHVGVWDLTTGESIAQFRGPNWQVRWMKDSQTIAAASGSGVNFYNAADGARKAVYRPMPEGRGVLISAGGHYSGTPGAEKGLIYQAVSFSGQSTLSPEEFKKRFGWKNDPSKVRLIEKPGKETGVSRAKPKPKPKPRPRPRVPAPRRKSRK